MIGPIARIGDAFRIGPVTAWLVAVAGVAGVTVVAAVATRLNMLPVVLVLIAGVFATVVSFRWPLVTLALFAMFIPIEEVVQVDGIGTISRIAAIMFAVTYGIPRLTHLTLGAMPRAAWLYVIWATLSLGWAISPDAAGAELPTLVQLFIVAVLIADFVVHRPEIVRSVLWVYSLSAAATAVIGVGAYLTQGVGSRAVALSTDAAQFAAILVPAFVFGLFEVLNGRRRLLGGAIALVTSMGVVVSGTRGAWLALLAVVALFVLPQLPARQRVAAIVAVAVLLVAAYQLPGVADLIAERSGNALTTGGAGRADIWTVATHIYQSAPVLGVGFANFPIAYTPEAVAAANITSAYRIEVGNAPHSLLVGTAVELGPIGLLLLAWFLGPLLLRRGWGPEAAAVQAGLASLMVVALFLDVFSNRKQVWLIIGLAAGLGYLARTAEDHGLTGRRRWLGWLRRSPAPASEAAAAVPPGPNEPAVGLSRRPVRDTTEIRTAPPPRKPA
jgi:O-antigen ligase